MGSLNKTVVSNHETTFSLVLNLFCVSFGKPCRGRVRVGYACSASCDYSTGQWKRGGCSPSADPVLPPCLTVKAKECVLPFTYKGELVETCTVQNSANKKPWCATAVNEDREVLDGRWEDCSPDNEDYCNMKWGDCEYFCDAPQDGNTTCSFKYSGESFNGNKKPAQFGNCNNERERCYQPEACNLNCEYGCENYLRSELFF
eukprot:TRINITY_DN14456_c0_g1_i1.p1 TRINITY_DN14456_c0_g1~~TRINITY_DN14456_c0_g1_i1.p1  ORF type:complete len:202 (-),score=19.28 TRINITY_DN14456_c0_g1_i1:55-660(-)